MKYVNLFLSDRQSREQLDGDVVALFEGSSTIVAHEKKDGTIGLVCSAINYTDARVFGRGMLKPTAKRSANFPDLKGDLKKPDEDGEWTVAAWWKKTKEGDRYLSLSLNEAPPAQHNKPQPADSMFL